MARAPSYQLTSETSKLLNKKFKSTVINTTRYNDNANGETPILEHVPLEEEKEEQELNSDSVYDKISDWDFWSLIQVKT